MGIRKYEVYTCDRCNKQEDIRKTEQEWTWSRITAYDINGPMKIHDAQHNPRLICQECSKQLYKWWRQE